MRVRVAIADDQPLVRDGFRVQLGLAGDMEFAGEASTGEQAVALARRERPDVLLMDVRMPVLDGIEATRRITADPRTAGVRVLVLIAQGLSNAEIAGRLVVTPAADRSSPSAYIPRCIRYAAVVRDSASWRPAPRAAAPPNVGSVYLIHDIFRGELP